MASPERGRFIEKVINVGNALDVVGFIWGAASGNVGLMVIYMISFGAGQYAKSKLRSP